jgi:Myb/SANT-like DNA-binding domain
LNKKYKIFRAFVEQSSFGWDDDKQLPTAPDDVWAAYIEVPLDSVLFAYIEIS